MVSMAAWDKDSSSSGHSMWWFKMFSNTWFGKKVREIVTQELSKNFKGTSSGELPQNGGQPMRNSYKQQPSAHLVKSL